jgi:hypothetical protein
MGSEGDEPIRPQLLLVRQKGLGGVRYSAYYQAAATAKVRPAHPTQHTTDEKGVRHGNERIIAAAEAVLAEAKSWHLTFPGDANTNSNYGVE